MSSKSRSSWKEKLADNKGLPMEKAEDYGGGDINNKYCKYCAPDGKLMSREQIREGWTNYIIKTEHISRDKAEKRVDEEMAKMPAWK